MSVERERCQTVTAGEERGYDFVQVLRVTNCFVLRMDKRLTELSVVASKGINFNNESRQLTISIGNIWKSFKCHKNYSD